MIIYRATKKQFVEDVFNNTIADNIDEAFYEHLGRHTSPNEVRSWQNSMQFMYKVVDTPELPDDAGVAIEYQIPLTAKRVDFIVSGLNAQKKEQIIIIELKQWEDAEPTNKPGIVVARFQHGKAEVAHPSYQAWSYAYMLSNYNLSIQERDVQIKPCAFLHNYTPDGMINGKLYEDYVAKAPVFLKNDAARLQDYILRHVRYCSPEDIIWKIDNGKLRPSKQLADSLTSMLKGNDEFVMLDDQKVVFEAAVYLAKKAQEGKKQVLIVEGGPGTGKSVLAINLLVSLTSEGIASQYVTKNSAPRAVYSVKLSSNFRRTYINNLFVGSGNFIETLPNTMGALIVDEAHRLNMKSGMFSNLGENQIKEIIKTARFSVFFVDDCQRIHMKDIGSVQYIKQCAEEMGTDVHLEHLSSQFRCNGSDGYLSWLDNALQIRETANIRLTEEDYDFRIFDSPTEMFNEIKRKNESNNKSRVVAGYCWDWNSKQNHTAYDIIIPQFGFRKQWNFNSNEPWLIGEKSIDQIGCIHTCQGLELDYVGVIVGPDLSYKNNRVVTDGLKRSPNDQSLKGFRSMLRDNPKEALQQADAIIKNTYRTLMTRGMKGCYVYFCDPALAEHFRELMAEKPTVAQEVRIEPVVNDDVKYIDYLPVYSIKAACGYFGEGDEVSELGWIRAEGVGRLNRNMYVVQASGHSMEPRINDGDFCVFRANPAGSRQGKIVLVQHTNYYDADYSGAYSIKEYSSAKSYDEFGNWQHEKIELKPYNRDYNPIIINADDAEDFRVLGEFVGVLG
jgi:DUF2075 family protein/chromosomal replication initiation ATPase DnaA